jgi:hypothetical protein
MGTSMIPCSLKPKEGELMSAVICDHFLRFQWVEFQSETESFKRQGTSTYKGDVNERPGPVGHRLVGGGRRWTTIRQMVFFFKKILRLHRQRTVQTQNPIKDRWPEPSQGKTKTEGQRKAKRRTAHKNQTKERASPSWVGSYVTHGPSNVIYMKIVKSTNNGGSKTSITSQHNFPLYIKS